MADLSSALEPATLRRLLEIVPRLGAQRGVEPVLRQVLDAARELTGARYAAIGVPDDRDGFARFLTAGVDNATWARIGALPRTHGLLGAVLREPAALRLADIRTDPRFSGYPGAHPEMGAFLAVPILADGEVVAEIFLTHPAGIGEFSEADLRVVQALAGYAALAVVTAQRQERVRELSIVAERNRIARELHDSVTQTLFSLTLAAESALVLAAQRAGTEPAGQPTRDLAGQPTGEPGGRDGDTSQQPTRDLPGQPTGDLPGQRTRDLAGQPTEQTIRQPAGEPTAQVGDEPTEELHDQLRRVRALARLGLAELRELVDTLRPADLGRDGLPSALHARVDLLRAVHGVPIELRVRLDRPVDTELARELLKIANEALANSLRHATAGKVSVELHVTASVARLVVADDGVGFDLPGIRRASRRLGLTSMRDRAEAVGGALRIDTAPGAGTTVTLEVPLP